MLAAPHPQGYLYRLLEHLEAHPLRREGDPEPPRLLLVVAGPDAEPGASAREHVERGHRLYEDGRVAEVNARHHRPEPDPLGVGGQERERRVALRLVRLRASHHRVLPDVVRHADAVEARVLGRPRDLGQRSSIAFCSTGPIEAVELKSELHGIIPPSPAPVSFVDR